MPELTEKEWKSRLSAGTLDRVYVLYGEEKFLVRKAALQIADKAAGTVLPEFNKNEFTNDTAIDTIADAVEALPVMAEHKCVLVSDYNIEEKDQTEQDKLSELLSDLPDSTSLVFWYPTLGFDGKKAKWKKFLKEAEKTGCTLCCGRRETGDLKKLLMKEAEKAGCVLSGELAGLVVEYAGQDMVLLQNELKKLCAFAGSGEITRDMVEALVSKTTETTVFLMANALIAGNHEKAYRLMDTLFYQNEEPVAILGALSSSYVDMYRVRAALQSGLSSTAPTEYGEYKGREFRLRNAERNAKGLDTPQLQKSLEALLEADLKLKGSKLPARIVMDEVIAKLLLVSRG